MELCYTSTNIISWSIDKMEITLDAIKNDSHSITTIWKQYAGTAFLWNMWGSFHDTSCHSCRKCGGTGIFFLRKTRSTIGSAVVAMSRDRLTELTVKAMHNHAILILKADICKSYKSTHPHWMTASLMTLDLLDLFIFCRSLRLWHWYLT